MLSQSTPGFARVAGSGKRAGNGCVGHVPLSGAKDRLHGAQDIPLAEVWRPLLILDQGAPPQRPPLLSHRAHDVGFGGVPSRANPK